MKTTDKNGTVAILPYGVKLGAFPSSTPLDALIWPLGKPARLDGKTLRDMQPQDHLIIYPNTLAHFRPSFGTRAKISIMVVEPKALHSRHLRRLLWSHRKFHRVLSAQEDFLDRIPNGIFLPFGTTWVPEWQDLDTTKRANISLVASQKRDLDGHKLRHEIAEWSIQSGMDVALIGRGYKPFSHKSEGLAPYRFSIVIENVREKNYFTEKLIDAVLCETVPIYWGCPNIDKFLDTSGMIICESADDLKMAIRNADASIYEKYLPSIRAIKKKAAHWADLETRAAKSVLAI